MDVYVARQPILDTAEKVVAYELLYRAGPENRFPPTAANLAAATVIEQALTTFGLDKLAPRTRAFVNITRQVLVDELYRFLPTDRVVLELLETIVPDAETLAACDNARRHGYTLALDDYAFEPDKAAFVEKVSIVKVEWPAIDKAGIGALVAPLLRRGTSLLAEKVETREDVAIARAAGFALFQGFYFCRPEMVQTRDIPGSKLNSLQLMRVVSQPSFRLDEVEALLHREVALSVRLLKYLNSAAFSLRSEVKSLRQALVYLGERPLRTWVSVMALTGLGADRPAELLAACLVRARCCELLGQVSPRKVGVDLFLLGMLSLVDAMLGRPLDEILQQTGVSREVEAALLRGEGQAGLLFRVAVDLERARFDGMAEAAATLGVEEEALAMAYRDAVAWADGVLQAW